MSKGLPDRYRHESTLDVLGRRVIAVVLSSLFGAVLGVCYLIGSSR